MTKEKLIETYQQEIDRLELTQCFEEPMSQARLMSSVKKLAISEFIEALKQLNEAPDERSVLVKFLTYLEKGSEGLSVDKFTMIDNYLNLTNSAKRIES